MFYLKNYISELMPLLMMLQLFFVTTTSGTEILRYSPHDPRIEPLLEGAGKAPRYGMGMKIVENITGTWKAWTEELVIRGVKVKSQTEANAVWDSMVFYTNNLVEISYELAKNGEKRCFVGTYEFVHQATRERPVGPNIVIRSQSPEDENIGVLIHIFLGELSIFPSGLRMLSFRDPDDYKYFFYRTDISSEELRKRMGAITGEELEQMRAKNRKQRKLRDKRITDPDLTKAIIERFQSGEFDEEPIPPDLEWKERKAAMDARSDVRGKKHNAILNLMNYGDETCVPILINIVTDEQNHFIFRQNAIRALEKIGDVRAVPVLLEILGRPVEGDIEDEGETEAILRRQAASALRTIADPAALPLLKTIAESAKEYETVRDYARSAVKKLEDK